VKIFSSAVNSKCVIWKKKLFYCQSPGLCHYISYFRCIQTAFSYGQQMRLCAFSCLGTYWKAVVLQCTTTTLHIEGIIATASYLETPQEILVSCKRNFFNANTHTHTVLSYDSWNYIIHTLLFLVGKLKKNKYANISCTPFWSMKGIINKEHNIKSLKDVAACLIYKADRCRRGWMYFMLVGRDSPLF